MMQDFFPKAPAHEVSDSSRGKEPLNSSGFNANKFYFDHPEWTEEYFTYCHRNALFKERWEIALGDLSDKTVVDIGCGPGNVFATVSCKPKLLIGVDIAPYSLEMAKASGYETILADAHDLPFISGFADVVTLNATLHHCDEMEKVLKEAARIVKPGGVLITDHDPQKTAWDYKGPAKLLWDFREILYKIMKKGIHKTKEQQYWALESEIHHKPGHGVTSELFTSTLTRLGFSVKVYPHNHTKGKEVFEGDMGKAEFKYVLGNLLSGRRPSAPENALSLMCIAKKEG